MDLDARMVKKRGLRGIEKVGQRISLKRPPIKIIYKPPQGGTPWKEQPALNAIQMKRKLN